MKKIISTVLLAATVLAMFAGFSIGTNAATPWLDGLYINESAFGASENYKNESVLTIMQGDRIYILGWVAFSSTDGLKEIRYSIDGTEYACEDVYRDRTDLAPNGITSYNNGAHAGFGKDDHMMELTGIGNIPTGEHRLVITAYSNKNNSVVVAEYTVAVTGAVAQLDAVQINEKVFGASENVKDRDRLTIEKGGSVYILGWVTFFTEDKLNRIVYSADGVEHACADNYRNREDISTIGMPVYNNGEHAGYGTESKMFELTGIGDLTPGMHEIEVTACSDGGKRATVCSFTLRVMSVDTGGDDPGVGDVNGDGKVNNKDVVVLFRYVSGSGIEVDETKTDVNGDGKVNNKDVIYLFKLVSGETEGEDYAGTPAYTVNGDTITANGVKYPNTNNMKNGLMYAMDDLGRELPGDAGGYSYDGGKNVGIFYFLWLGEHGDWGVFDITKILEEGGSAAKSASYSGWGPVGAMHFWGEPLLGYYYSRDKWVMRKHIEELTLANIDFLYIDATNAYPYINNALALMSIMHEFNEQGYKAPKIVFYTHSSCSATVNSIYQNIYSKNKYSDTWLYVDGKPLIIAYQSECRSGLGSDVYNFFSYREPQWPNEGQKKNGWPWMDFNYPQRVFYNNSNKAEAISVSVAQHSGTVCFSDSAIYGNRTNRGRSFSNGRINDDPDAVLYGYNFAEQFSRAIKANVPYILVTGWNEWVAQRQDPASMGRSGQAVFVDTASIEYSRDIEPMRGGYFDNYYIQLIDWVSRYKGTAPALIQDTRKTIKLTGGFDQWNSIFVTYTDPEGDTADRKSLSFGSKTLTDTSGNNDIVAAKVVHDSKNIYFYVETADDISSPGKGSWMQLFVNSDYDGYTGFYGFDYIVNYSPTASGRTTVAKCKKTDAGLAVESEETVYYKASGKKMMITVPLEYIGISDSSDIKIAFKWVDSDTKITTMEQMYSEGDIAPLGRLCYTFQNHG